MCLMVSWLSTGQWQWGKPSSFFFLLQLHGEHNCCIEHWSKSNNVLFHHLLYWIISTLIIRMMATFARCKGSIILVTRFLALPLLVLFGEDPFYSRKRVWLACQERERFGSVPVWMNMVVISWALAFGPLLTCEQFTSSCPGQLGKGHLPCAESIETQKH